MKFNERQQEAVDYYDGPILVLAGAGSGKTRCIVGKIFDLIEKGHSLNGILAFTFTNKAANEIKERVKERFEKSNAKWIGTIHSICVKILRLEKSEFGICDKQDSILLVKEAMANVNCDPKETKPRDVATKISQAKMSMFLPEHAKGDVIGNDYVKFYGIELSVYAEYDRILKKCGLKDFDDLILDAVLLFEKYPDLKIKYREIFQYVLVDEYQDINPVQDKLIKFLCNDGKNLTVVGDDQQSIYGFRGSAPGFIIDFENHYDNVKIVRLEQNYRSTTNIIDAANGLIACSETGLQKKLWAENKTGDKITIVKVENDTDEARYVGDTISTFVEMSGSSFGDFVILYRTNAQAQAFDVEFTKRSIPHRVVNSLSFFERLEVRDIVAYLKFLKNPYDVISFKRSVNKPARKIGSKSQERIIERANEEYNGNLLKSLMSDSGMCWQFGWFMNEIGKKVGNLSAAEIIKEIVDEIKYEEFLEKKYDDSEDRKKRLEILKDIARNKNHSLDSFLLEITLVSDVDEYDPNENTVKLMTIHASKGLEFNNVFVVGCENNLLPFVSLEDNYSQFEEERRLFYVAVTRAREQLYLTMAKERYLRGQLFITSESVFLSELPKNLLIISEEKK